MNENENEHDSGSAGARNTVVVAGAGTGKTYALVTRYLDALLGSDALPGQPAAPRSPDRILALTFTDKAASEMRARAFSSGCSRYEVRRRRRMRLRPRKGARGRRGCRRAWSWLCAGRSPMRPS